jgi:hypothetical protein
MFAGAVASGLACWACGGKTLDYSHRHVNPYTLMTIICILMPTQGRQNHPLDVLIALATAIHSEGHVNMYASMTIMEHLA